MVTQSRSGLTTFTGWWKTGCISSRVRSFVTAWLMLHSWQSECISPDHKPKRSIAYMGKFISNLFLGALAIGLSIFTGSRTLDLLAWALPANQVIYQWLGLAAFEGGMYFWSFYFVYGAKGTPQRSISVVMAVF